MNGSHHKLGNGIVVNNDKPEIRKTSESGYCKTKVLHTSKTRIKNFERFSHKEMINVRRDTYV